MAIMHEAAFFPDDFGPHRIGAGEAVVFETEITGEAGERGAAASVYGFKLPPSADARVQADAWKLRIDVLRVGGERLLDGAWPVGRAVSLGELCLFASPFWQLEDGAYTLLRGQRVRLELFNTTEEAIVLPSALLIFQLERPEGRLASADLT